MNLAGIDYRPPRTISAFHACGDSFRVLRGPIGSGKTTGCVFEIVMRAMRQAPAPDGYRYTRWAVIRNTNEQLRDTTLKSWMSWFPEPRWGYYKVVDKTFFLQFGDVRAEILFRPLDTEDDQRRLLSLDLTGAYINEMREIPLSIATAVRSRCGRYPSGPQGRPTWWGTIADTNSFDTDHWIYEKFEVERPKGWVMFSQPGGMDPAAENKENLPPGYYEDMIAGNDKRWIDIHVHNKYGPSRDGKPVFEDKYIDEFHTAKEELMPIQSYNYPVVIGLDFGRTPAAVLKQRDWKGRVLALDEVVAENMALTTFLERKLIPFISRPKYRGCSFAVCGDPAGWAKSQFREENAKQILTAAGFTENGPAPTNDIGKRLDAVERLLLQQIEGKALYLVSPTCTVLLQGFRGKYRFKVNKSGMAEAYPVKDKYSHPHDANQYADLVINAGLTGVRRPRAVPDVPAQMAGWT